MASEIEQLDLACKAGDLEKVKTLVTRVDFTSGDKSSALWGASREGHLKIVKYLHENKADITAQNNLAVHVAGCFGRMETVKFLVENNADITANAANTLRYANMNGYPEMVKYIENILEFPLSNRSILKEREKYLPEKTVPAFLESKLESIRENLVFGRNYEFKLEIFLSTPLEKVVAIIVSWLKEKGMENAEKRLETGENFSFTIKAEL